MINKKLMQGKIEGSLLLLTMACLLFFVEYKVVYASEAEVQQQENFSARQEADSMHKPDVLKIEEEIYGLIEIDSDKIREIQNAIFQQEPKEQERLQNVFDKRIEELFSVEHEKMSSSEYQDLEAQQYFSFEDIKFQIDSLNLGREASIEDLQKRDKLLNVIINIKDPILRYELLQYLDNKEREEGIN